MEKVKMEEILKILLFNILYSQLNLMEVERRLEEKKVVPKEIIYPNYAIKHVTPKYIMLENDIHLENLSKEGRKKLEDYMLVLDDQNIPLMNEIYTFLDNIKLKLLIPDTPDRYLYYGPVSFEYMAPRDSIVLGVHYQEYTEPYNEMLHDQIQDFIIDTLNYLQDEVGPQHNLPVAAIAYNEISFSKEKMI